MRIHPHAMSEASAIKHHSSEKSVEDMSIASAIFSLKILKCFFVIFFPGCLVPAEVVFGHFVQR